jgi:histidinol-phosphate aminotransferase
MTSRSSFSLDGHVRPGARAVAVPDSRPLGDIVNLSSNELSHEIIRELFRDFASEFDAERISRYPRHAELRAQTASFFAVDTSQLLFAPGSDAAIRIAVGELLGRGGSLLLQAPNYRAYERYARLADAPIETFPYLRRTADAVAADLIERIAGRSPSLVALVNPNGYTGEVLPLPIVASIAGACCDHGHLLVVDEAYGAFGDLDHAVLLGEFPNLVVIRSLSKGFGIAGLRLGVVLARQELADHLRKSGIEDCVSSPTLGFWAHLMRNAAALEAVRRDVRAVRAWFRERLGRWRSYDSQANFVAIDFDSSRELACAFAALCTGGYRVKLLDDVPELVTCLRITIAERRVMERVADVLDSRPSAAQELAG